MKPTTITVETTSTVAGTAQTMGIDPEGMATVLSILSNMYSDGDLAVVREYASNALDSHIESGNQEAILVTSPSHFNPVLTVQDFGIGLSRDEVLNVYAKYGASTKRDANDQIGSFGIGAKSAFTIGTQFTVTAVKDGMETIALFALNDLGAPTVNIIAHRDTLEPNGVKVEVGVRNVDGVHRAIDKLFATWKRGTVSVDGIEPASVWDDLPALSDDVHMTWRENHYATRDEAWTVVMGGVPYTITGTLIDSLPHRQRMIAANAVSSQAKIYLTVPIGAVDITPSREELRVTDKTRDAITALVEKFGQLVGPWVTEQIASAKSRIEALKLLREFRSKIGHVAPDAMRSVQWRGAPVGGVNIDYPDVEWFTLKHKRGYYGTMVARRVKGLLLHDADPFEKFLFVTDVPDRRVRSVQLAARAYLSDQDGLEGGHNRVIALTGNPASYKQDWFDLADPALAKITFEDFIRDWKPAATPSQRGAVAYKDEADLTWHADELNDYTGKIFYFLHYEWSNMSANSPLLKRVQEGHPLIILKSTQKAEALQKRVPAAVSAQAAVDAEARKLLSHLSPADVDAITAQSIMNEPDHQIAKFLVTHEAKITNPAVRDWIDDYERAQVIHASSSARLELLRAAARATASTLASTRPSTLTPGQWAPMLAKLPLLEMYFSGWHRSRSSLADGHVIDYINSIKI